MLTTIKTFSPAHFLKFIFGLCALLISGQNKSDKFYTNLKGG
jgi:hypothetical protein